MLPLAAKAQVSDLAPGVAASMVKAAKAIVVVCDSNKFNRRSLSKIVDASSIHHVITDSNLPKETTEALRNLNIKLTLV